MLEEPEYLRENGEASAFALAWLLANGVIYFKPEDFDADGKRLVCCHANLTAVGKTRKFVQVADKVQAGLIKLANCLAQDDRLREAGDRVAELLGGDMPCNLGGGLALLYVMTCGRAIEIPYPKGAKARVLCDKRIANAVPEIYEACAVLAKLMFEFGGIRDCEGVEFKSTERPEADGYIPTRRSVPKRYVFQGDDAWLGYEQEDKELEEDEEFDGVPGEEGRDAENNTSIEATFCRDLIIREEQADEDLAAEIIPGIEELAVKVALVEEPPAKEISVAGSFDVKPVVKKPVLEVAPIGVAPAEKPDIEAGVAEEPSVKVPSVDVPVIDDSAARAELESEGFAEEAKAADTLTVDGAEVNEAPSFDANDYSDRVEEAIGLHKARRDELCANAIAEARASAYCDSENILLAAGKAFTSYFPEIIAAWQKLLDEFLKVPDSVPYTQRREMYTALASFGDEVGAEFVSGDETLDCFIEDSGVVVVPPEYDALEERVKAVRPRRYAGMAGSGASFAQALIPHIQIDGMDLVSMVKGFSTIGLNLSNAELAALINCLAESRGMTERVSEFDVSTCQRVFAKAAG